MDSSTWAKLRLLGEEAAWGIGSKKEAEVQKICVVIMLFSSGLFFAVAKMQ